MITLDKLKKGDIVQYGGTLREEPKYYNIGIVDSVTDELVYIRGFQADGTLSSYNSHYRFGQIRKILTIEDVSKVLKDHANHVIERNLATYKV